MGRTAKMIGFSVPPVLLREVEQMAKEERRTKSELFREMVRVYQRYRRQREQDEDQWIMNLIREAKEEQKRNPMSEEDMLKESEELARYGAGQAKKLGIKPKDVNQIIYEVRKSGRSS